MARRAFPECSAQRYATSTRPPGVLGHRCPVEYSTVEYSTEAYSTVLYDNDNRRVQLPGYRADACTDAAIRYVAEQHALQRAVSASGGVAKPFFLFLSFIEPHHQNRTDDYPAPTGYQEAAQRELW